MKKNLRLCDNCNSDNIQIKAWINPNNNKIIDEVEGEEDVWCEDCQGHHTTTEIEKNSTDKVEGFQVVNDNNEIHPDMDGSFCLYNLTQANNMIDPNPSKWKLLTCWTGDVEEPTYMFEGNPRD